MRDDLKSAAQALVEAAEELLDVKFKYASGPGFIQKAERVKAEQFVKERVDAMRAALKPSHDLPEGWAWKQGELAMAAEQRVGHEAFTCFVHADQLVFDMSGLASYTGLVPLDVVHAVIERDYAEGVERAREGYADAEKRNVDLFITQRDTVLREAGASLKKEDGAQLLCDTHGKQPWNGQVICAEDVGGCGRVWHLGDEDHALHPPEELGTNCVCGKSLTELVPDSHTTARPVCPQCFEGVRAAREAGTS